jgi:hypothetical protein
MVMFRRGPLIEPVSLVLAALRQRPTASCVRRTLDVAIWRLVARLWLASMVIWLIVVLLPPAAPATVTRAVALLATVAAVEVWSSVLRRTARSAAPQLRWLIQHDPLLVITLLGTAASTLGWAGLAITAGTAAAPSVINSTGGLLYLVALLYVVRLMLGFVVRVLHRLGVHVPRLYAFRPHPGALHPYNRLER